jgi:anthranilate synthase component 1
MKRYKIGTVSRKILADTVTPVSIYLKARDIYPNSLLLESSDYHGASDSYSFICLKPQAWFILDKGEVLHHFPDGREKRFTPGIKGENQQSPTLKTRDIKNHDLGNRDLNGPELIYPDPKKHDPNNTHLKNHDPKNLDLNGPELNYPDPKNHDQQSPDMKHPDLKELFRSFSEAFQIEGDNTSQPFAGLFGYTSYDTVRYFEKTDISAEGNQEESIPDMVYTLYRYVIAINHFRNELTITEFLSEGESSDSDSIVSLIANRNIPGYNFDTIDQEKAGISEQAYMEMVKKGKEHCFRGNILQIVLSRKFSLRFRGDEFNVYRSLRSVNPSPYLFYFDYGNYRIFGSSPEAHLKIEKRKATINPIAGTFRRTGDDASDKELALKLMDDPKENSEHIMLVDLARNDLGRYASDIKIESLREIQYYSHVIHMVSTVSGILNEETDSIDMLAATFPAGTLTGAPKHRAMQLINSIESDSRGFYGGAIGFIGFNGDFNHAIMIRTFLSKNNTLIYRAGAGVVAGSDPATELNEVNNKLGALRRAVTIAKNI